MDLVILLNFDLVQFMLTNRPSGRPQGGEKGGAGRRQGRGRGLGYTALPYRGWCWHKPSCGNREFRFGGRPLIGASAGTSQVVGTAASSV